MRKLRLRLPATSANLGPGFDTLGLAMALYLTLEVEEAETTTIHAIGRDAALTGALERNLILTTYRDILRRVDRPAPELRLTLQNQIPLGMGCGSSAAALLAGVHLANHFGGLGWSPHRALTEACLREGHPDNVAACALGGMTVSIDTGGDFRCATVGRDLPWKLLLAIPGASFATEKARALLPPTYPRGDIVANIQRTSLLVAAFALARPELLRDAMQDLLHQPYRAIACPLLPRLLPLAGTVEGVYGAALSGAGPSVLLILDPQADLAAIGASVREASGDPRLELVTTTIAGPAEILP